MNCWAKLWCAGRFKQRDNEHHDGGQPGWFFWQPVAIRTTTERMTTIARCIGALPMFLTNEIILRRN